ncbi:MAG: phosphoribosyl-AMP cyclohydrolase [Oleiphilaceae bacterium]|nr:phosphoribosyl-AMP cyclohydrolase [Oleiphilaceae bacterium]
MSHNSDWLDQVAWNDQGLVPAIAQDAQDGTLLMMAWMNREALALTVEKGEAVYWSRSRQSLWHKGEQSGHTQTLHSLHIDCDNDVILMKVDQKGGIACHTGRHSCFYREYRDGAWVSTLDVIRDPDSIYGPSS